MKVEIYPNNKNFIDNYIDFNGDTLFPMTKDYILRDECYTDDDWIKWVKYSMDDGTPLALIGERLLGEEPDSRHISVYEVNKDYRGLGLGTQVLQDYLQANDKWTLYSMPENANFYKILGFSLSTNEGYKNFYRRG